MFREMLSSNGFNLAEFTSLGLTYVDLSQLLTRRHECRWDLETAVSIDHDAQNVPAVMSRQAKAEHRGTRNPN